MNTMKYLSTKIEEIKEKLEMADAVVIGAGSGLSSAAGLTYAGERFHKNFSEFIEAYGMQDMYSAGFYPFPGQEEKWAYWSRHIYLNRYEPEALPVYKDLYDIVKGKNYFVLTTNVDHQFWKAGFEDARIFATQGDYGLFQCKKGCHKKLYDNEPEVRAMIQQQKNLKIPKDLVPKCPVCGGQMEVHLRCDHYFVENDDWHKAHDRYEDFLRKKKGKQIVFIELGVGMNTPGIIKYPFWQLTYNIRKASYICINMGEAAGPEEIAQKAVYADGDIAEIIKDLREERG